MIDINEILERNHITLENTMRDGLIKEAMQEYADEFAVDFAEWKDKLNAIKNPECFNEVKYGISVTDYDWEINTTTELLEIFKNEIK